MSHHRALLKRVVQIGRYTGDRRKIGGEDGGRGAGHFHAPHLIRGIPGERERRHVAVLAANHFSERVVGAVIGTRLPLGAEIFQAEVGHLLAARIDVVFLGSQRAGPRYAHIVAGIAQRGAAQEVHASLIAAGYVEPVLRRDWKQEWPDLVDGRKKAQAHIGEAIVLHAAVHVRTGDVVAKVAGDPGRSQRGLCSGRGRAARFGWQDLPAAGVDEVIIAQGTEQIRPEISQRARKLRHFAPGGILADRLDVRIVAGETEAGLRLIHVGE